jgi:hypothetical protein
VGQEEEEVPTAPQGRWWGWAGRHTAWVGVESSDCFNG